MSCGVQGGQVRASVAFPALALFDLLREPIRSLPSSISAYINAFVAQKRLQEFLGVRAVPAPCLHTPGLLISSEDLLCLTQCSCIGVRDPGFSDVRAAVFCATCVAASRLGPCKALGVLPTTQRQDGSMKPRSSFRAASTWSLHNSSQCCCI